MSDPSATILDMEITWTKYTYVCDPNECDSLVEFTCEDTFGSPSGDVRYFTCPCGRNMQLVSVQPATIHPITNERNKMEETTFDWEQSSKSWQQKAENFERMFETYRDKTNNLQSQINKIIDNLTEEYWYSESTPETILEELCEILGHEPKKEISFNGIIHFSGRIDVPMNEVLDFDLTEALADVYVDIQNGDVVIDNYDLEDVEEL